MAEAYESVLQFWFVELDTRQWFKQNTELDQTICARFGGIHRRASQCELYDWRQNVHGRLAEIIVLDQFSRNIFRDTPQAFAFDALALALAQEAVGLQADRELKPVERSFLYMPYMHSESAIIHEIAVQLYDQPELEYNLEFEHKHKVIIDRFGRYPHRNTILERESTPEELEFLKQPGSGF